MRRQCGQLCRESLCVMGNILSMNADRPQRKKTYCGVELSDIELVSAVSRRRVAPCLIKKYGDGRDE
jgi:hypothetical protein